MNKNISPNGCFLLLFITTISPHRIPKTEINIKSTSRRESSNFTHTLKNIFHGNASKCVQFTKKKTEKTIITTMTATETETKIKSKKCIILLVFKRIRHFLRELKSIKSNITGFFFLQFMWSCWFCYFFSCVLNPPFTFWPKSHVKFSGARLFFRRILSFFSHFYIKTTTVTFIGHHWFPFSLVFFFTMKSHCGAFFYSKIKSYDENI